MHFTKELHHGKETHFRTSLLKALAVAAPAATAVAVNVASLKVADMLDAIRAKTLTATDAVTELTRRIDQRAAAGKHPMVHVIAARDQLVAA